MTKRENYIKYNNKDTGIRGTFWGSLYIDKRVFFKRPEVQKAIASLKNSDILKLHIKDNNKKLILEKS